MPTQNATPSRAIAAVRWFSARLRYTSPDRPRDADEIPRELRAAADEFEKYYSWECFDGIPMEVEVGIQPDRPVRDSVIQAVQAQLGMTYMEITAIGFDITPSQEEKE